MNIKKVGARFVVYNSFVLLVFVSVYEPEKYSIILTYVLSNVSVVFAFIVGLTLSWAIGEAW